MDESVTDRVDKHIQKREYEVYHQQNNEMEYYSSKT